MGKVFVYQELYSLVEHCNITLTEAWDMPIEVRRWWIGRKMKDLKEKNAGESGKASQQSETPIPKSLRR